MAGRPGPSRGRDERLAAMMRFSRDLIIVRDDHGVIVWCSPAVERVLGHSPDELAGTPARELVHPEDRRGPHGFGGVSPPGTERPLGELRLRNRDGTWRWFEAIETNRLDDPAVEGIVTSARDVTDHKAVEDMLLGLSLCDTLTGLPNRTLLLDNLTKALARTARACRVLAVIFCDLDDFKAVNDGRGHRVGDLVLREVANRIHRTLRTSDTLARAGGDEFVAVCDGLGNGREAVSVAERIRDTVEAPMVIDDVGIVVSVSIGIATVVGDAASTAEPMTLLRNADAAMYKAKQRGRARWELFDETLLAGTALRSELEPDLRRALARNELALYFQPIVELADGGVVGAEALLRWHHPTRGTLLPDQFIDLAEETGLIVPIGAWVVAAACAQAARWRRAGGPTWVSVNLSVREVVDPGLTATVADALARNDLPPEALWLELTETALLRAGHSAAVGLDALRELGVHLGMVDFGGGYASVTDLQRLPIDFLKIDRGYVANLKGHATGVDNAIVAAITGLGMILDLTTIAQGIETQEEADVLRDYGCRYGQGCLLAEPSPPSNLDRVRRLVRVR